MKNERIRLVAQIEAVAALLIRTVEQQTKVGSFVLMLGNRFGGGVPNFREKNVARLPDGALAGVIPWWKANHS